LPSTVSSTNDENGAVVTRCSVASRRAAITTRKTSLVRSDNTADQENGRYAGPEVGSRSIPAILFEDLYRQHGCCTGADFHSDEGRTRGIALLDSASNLHFVQLNGDWHASNYRANRGQSICMIVTGLVSAGVVSYLAMIAIEMLLELG
jgi:hypothetical protein